MNFMNKRGQGNVNAIKVVIKLLLVLFGATIMIILFGQILQNNLNPMFTTLINDSVGINNFTQADADEEFVFIAKYFTFWGITLILLFFIFVIGAIIKINRGRQQVEL